MGALIAPLWRRAPGRSRDALVLAPLTSGGWELMRRRKGATDALAALPADAPEVSGDRLSPPAAAATPW